MPKKKKIRKEFYNEDDVRDLNKKGVKRERKKHKDIITKMT